MPDQLTLAIYNSAGERVSTLYQGASSAVPQTLKPVGGNGTPWVFNLGVLLANGVSGVIWNSTTDAGQPVAPGSYSVKLEAVDEFGHPVELVAGLVVIQTVAASEVVIYNSAGEAVRHWDLAAEGMLGASLTQVDGGPLMVKTSDGRSVAVPFDGRNDQGQALQSGTYMAVLRTNGATGAFTEARSLVWLAKLGLDPLEGARLGPSPLTSLSGPLTLLYAASPGLVVTLRVYNVAGERIAEVLDPGSGRLTLDPSHLASGIYLGEASCRGIDGTLYRHRYKLAVLK